MHVRLEQRIGASSGALRFLHRRVGLRQQAATLAVVGVDDDADRHADPHGPTDDVDRLLRRVEDARRQRHGVVARRRTFHEDEELIAADPGHGVVVARRDAQPFGQLADDIVARRVSERVVDRLEAVDVDEQDRQLLAQPADRPGRAIGAQQGLREAVLEQHAIGQSGQRVEHRALAQFVVGRHQSGSDAFERAGQRRSPLVDERVPERAQQRAAEQQRQRHRDHVAQESAIEFACSEADRIDRPLRRQDRQRERAGHRDGEQHRHAEARCDVPPAVQFAERAEHHEP